MLRPITKGDDGHHRGDTDDNAEHGEKGSKPVRRHGQQRHVKRLLQSAKEAKKPISAFQAGGKFHRAACAVLAPVRDNFSVADFNNTIRLFSNRRFMRHQDDRMTVAMKLTQDLHDLPPAAAVERTGRFVRKNNPPAIHQRPGDGNALLLSA